jgi:hypothetical protein
MKYDPKDINRYDDIINLPHHVSKTRPPMSIINRAAQFSPFAALTGYDDAIEETARLTDMRVELDEAAKTILDKKLRIIQEHLNSQPEVTITYFRQDEKKEGGTYVSVSGTVKKIDGYKRTLLMQDGISIKNDDIISITGEIVQSL